MANNIMSAAAKPTLLQLLDVLQDPVSADWYTLGLRLGYDAGKLNIIKESNHHVVEDCMRELLTLWLQKYPDKGWSDIAGALREMDRNDVAGEVTRQYILPSPGTCKCLSTHYVAKSLSLVETPT